MTHVPAHLLRKRPPIFEEGKVEGSKGSQVSLTLATGESFEDLGCLGIPGLFSAPKSGSKAFLSHSDETDPLVAGYEIIPPFEIKPGEVVLFSHNGSVFVGDTVRITVNGQDILKKILDLVSTLQTFVVSTPQGPGTLNLGPDFSTKLTELKKLVE
jgi:phage gp45-like